MVTASALACMCSCTCLPYSCSPPHSCCLAQVPLSSPACLTAFYLVVLEIQGVRTEGGNVFTVALVLDDDGPREPIPEPLASPLPRPAAALDPSQGETLQQLIAMLCTRAHALMHMSVACTHACTYAHAYTHACTHTPFDGHCLCTRAHALMHMSPVAHAHLLTGAAMPNTRMHICMHAHMHTSVTCAYAHACTHACTHAPFNGHCPCTRAHAPMHMSLVAHDHPLTDAAMPNTRMHTCMCMRPLHAQMHTPVACTHASAYARMPHSMTTVHALARFHQWSRRDDSHDRVVLTTHACTRACTHVCTHAHARAVHTCTHWTRMHTRCPYCECRRVRLTLRQQCICSCCTRRACPI